MRYAGGVFVLALIGLFSTPASAEDQPAPLRFAPAGPWAVAYEDGACILKRDFENGDKTVQFAAQQSVPGYDFNMAIIAKGLKRRDRLDPKVAFVPGEEPRETGLPAKMIGPDGSLGFVARSDISGEVPPKSGDERADFHHNLQQRWLGRDLAYASQAREIYLRGVFWEAISLDTGSLKAPFVEMRRCVDSLIREWGYDPEAYARLSRLAKPIGNASSWVQAGDYPMRAAEKGQNARVYFRLDVSADGNVTNCTILSLLGPEIFADAVCDALRRRAQLSPAIDENGKAVPSFYASHVSWNVLP